MEPKPIKNPVIKSEDVKKVKPVNPEKLEVVETKNFNGQKIQITQQNFGPVLVRQIANMYGRLGYIIKLLEKLIVSQVMQGKK